MPKELKTYSDVREKIKSNKEIFDTERHLLSKPVQEAVDSTFDICNFLVNKVEELDNKISKNSRNSSKPPSTDDKDKIKKNQSLREKTDKKSGGQKGRKGSTVKKVEVADAVIEHELKGKCKCGIDLSQLNSSIHSSRQVFELEILKKAIEHRVYQGICECGEKHCSEYPLGVNAPVQFGNSVRAIVSYLSKYQLIASDRLSELMRDLFEMPVSEGSIDNFSGYAEKELKVFEEKIKDSIPELKEANADESPIRVNGKRGYLHVFCNKALTLLYYHKSRGMVAVDEAGLLKAFNGTLIHDCFSMYFNYGKSHAVCNAHLLRELTFIEEKYNLTWAVQVKTYLNDLNELVKLDKNTEETVLDSIAKDELRDEFYRLLDQGRIECLSMIKKVKNKGKKRGKQHPALNLLNRMIKLKKDILRFMYDYDIPFTNNQAERDLRMVKVHQKITGGFRSERGARNYALFRSYISTVKKHGLGVFEAIKNLYNPYENPTLDIIFKQYRPE